MHAHDTIVLHGQTVILLIVVISIPDENKSTETVPFTVFYMHDTKALDNLINRIAITLGNTVLLSHLLCVIHIKERFGGRGRLGC